MEESVILAGLVASRHQDRSEAVERIRADLRTSGGRLRFKSLDKLFASLKGLLRDSNWNVRRDTIALLGEVIPKAGKNAASCIQHVLPALVFNLGDTKGAIRRGALAGIRTCYDHRPDDIELAGVLIEEGIENPETRVRGEALRFMQCALPWDQSTDHEILLFGEAIVGRLRDVDTDVLLAACKVLERLPDQIGEESFTALIASLHPTLQSLYTSVLTVHRQQNAAPSVAGSDASTTGGNALEFGLISSATLASLCDERYEVRCDGMEDLEAAVNRVEYATAITPHLPGLLDLLEQLTGDTNLKVALGALEVMGLVVQKVGYPMRIELPKMMGPLLRMFGDSQVVVRQAVGKLMYRFMQFLTPTPVFEVLLASLNDRNWRVREEVCNVVILNVAKFPGQQLDFTKIVNALQPLLMDEKKRVKFVCLEAFSAVRKALGEVAYESVLQQNVPPAVIEEMELSGAGAQAQMRHSDGTTAMNASSPDVGPHHNPGIALKGAFTALKKGAIQETWEQATTGLVAIRQVLQHNSDVIANSLHVVVEAVIVEVQNLRSLVSRLAIMTVADIVERLTKMMEGKELDAVVAALCKKAAAEAGSSFIIASITESMTRIIDATATGKYIAAIIPHASHKTAIVRKMVVVRVTAVTERAQSKIFAVKDLERILAAMCKFSSDNDPTVRWYARKTFHIMSAHEQFEKILQKSLPASLLATASGIVDKVRRSGPGDPPKDAKARTVSAGSGSMRSPAKSARRGVTATGRPGVSSPATPSSAASARTPTARRTPLKVGSATPRRGGTGGAAGQAMRPALQEELDALVTKLTSSDWKERDAAVDMTEEMAAREGGGLRSGIGRLMDAYAGRLADPNSKVNKKALETYRRMLPDLAPAFDGQGPIVNEIVAKLTPNLASKNKVIRDETSAALEEMFGHLGSAVLLAPLVQAAGFGNSKVKGASLAILTNKVAAFFEESPKVAKRQFVTLVGQLLGDVKQKADLARLLQSLVSYMGVGGVTQAASSLPPNKQKILAAELTAPVMSIGAVGRNPKRDRNRTV